MSSKKAKSKKKHKQSDVNLFYLEYEITFDALEDKSLKKLPSKIRDQIEDFHTMVFMNPEKVIPELSRLKATYPKVPVFYNYLSMAYSRIGDFEKANAIILENYKRHSNYLFARVNYAHICLRRGMVEKIPIIFNNKFDLKQLYPHRRQFHVSEFVAFTGLMSMYHAEIGEMETAKLYYKMLKKIAPREDITKSVKRRLYPSLLIRVLRRLFSKEAEANSR